MNAHSLADDLGQWAATPHKSVVGFAGTDLVTGEDAILEAIIERTSFARHIVAHGTHLLRCNGTCHILWA